MKRLTMLCAFALTLTITNISAVAADNGILPTVTFKSAFANQYLAFGSGVPLYDKEVIQSDLFFSFPCGLYLDLWNSKSLRGKWNGSMGDEVDYGIGWAGTLKGFDCDLGITYFDEPGVFSLKSGDVLYSHIAVSRSIKKWDASWTLGGQMGELHSHA